jgi:leucyl aminopeptidase (aminopeptidase T)
MPMEAYEAAKNALQCVMEAKKDEKIIIFCDHTKAAIGEAFEKGAKELQLDTRLIILKNNRKLPRREIPAELEKYLTTDRADLYINLLQGGSEETPFRIKLIHKETEDKKTRLGHCPGVTLDMLTKGALALSIKEHKKMQSFAKTLMRKLKKTEKVEITTNAGTKLSFSVKNRPFFTDTMIDWKLMKWMNLPTGEVIIAPVEDSLEGKLVCDAAIGGIGPVDKPVNIKVKEGKVDAVTSENIEVLKKVQEALHIDSTAKVVGEFAFGINPKARFCEEFLETEKLYGTIHIAFGDNTDMPGGKNNSINHMDFMMHKPNVNAITSDGEVIKVLEDGKFHLTKLKTKTVQEPQEEKLPVSEVYKVIDHITIYKNDLWWEAIVIFETYGRRQIGMYLWQKRNGQWKRKNKFGIRTLEEWNKLKTSIEQLIPIMVEK